MLLRATGVNTKEFTRVNTSTILSWRRELPILSYDRGIQVTRP